MAQMSVVSQHAAAVMFRCICTVAAFSVLTACSDASGTAQPLTPHDLLLDAAPTGFTGKLDTSLSIDTASSNLSTDPRLTRTQLSSLGYSDGSEKVSGKGNEYVIDLVFEFNSTLGPGNVVSFVRSQLRMQATAILFDDGRIPGAQDFNLSAQTAAGGRQVFCQVALFPVGQYLFEVEDCDDGPRYSADPLSLARSQYERASVLLGLPAASSAPTST